MFFWDTVYCVVGDVITYSLTLPVTFGPQIAPLVTLVTLLLLSSAIGMFPL